MRFTYFKVLICMKKRLEDVIESIKHYPLSDNSIDYAEEELKKELSWGWIPEVEGSIKRLEELYKEGLNIELGINGSPGDTERINRWDKDYDTLMDDICDRSKRWYREYAEEMTDYQRPILPFDEWVKASDEERAILKEEDIALMEREICFRLPSKTLKVKLLRADRVTELTGLREIKPYGQFHILVGGDPRYEPDEVYDFVQGIRPVLWPISSITEWVNVGGKRVCWLYEMKKHLFSKKPNSVMAEGGLSITVNFIDGTIEFIPANRFSIEDVNFMYENNIDCNGLIEKGLAISALEEKVYE